jgi:Uma2 family endonuclease
VQFSLNEYLRTNYKPEREFVSGALLEKPNGTREHMQMERKLEKLLEPYETRGIGEALYEISFRNGNDVRIPDLAFVTTLSRYEHGILMDPPLLCVEILSPSQRLAEIVQEV